MTGKSKSSATPELEKCAALALRLPATERALLAERLIASLDSLDDAEIERMWVKEAEERYEASKKGLISSRPAEEVIREAREKIR